MFAALDLELFKACFHAWIGGLCDGDVDIIAIDGKTSRRSHDRRKRRNPFHLVWARAARQRILLGQQATEEKSNEITAIPLLLKHLDLKGALVTMDAMGTQTEIARAIRDGGGDYCMSLKKNWPAVYADVEQLFNDPPDHIAFETHETTDLTGGRIETRRHTVCHKVDWMTSDRHYPGEPVFPDLAMVGRIDPGLVVLAIGATAREHQTGFLAIRLDGLIHEYAVVVRVEAAQSKWHPFPHRAQHLCQQLLPPHQNGAHSVQPVAMSVSVSVCTKVDFGRAAVRERSASTNRGGGSSQSSKVGTTTLRRIAAEGGAWRRFRLRHVP